MGITPLESNYQYLNFGALTGGRKIGGAFPVEPQVGRVPGVETASNPPQRAVDKIPPLQMTDYSENIPAQAGYKAGVSHKMIWA